MHPDLGAFSHHMARSRGDSRMPGRANHEARRAARRVARGRRGQLGQRIAPFDKASRSDLAAAAGGYAEALLWLITNHLWRTS